MAYVLYGDKGSGAFCVAAALAEAGAAVETRPVNLDADEQRGEEFRALNPSGKIPVLVLPDGIVVAETAALLTLIAERHPEAQLLPAPGAADRGPALRWLSFMAAEIYPMVEVSDYPERFLADHKGAAVLKQAAKKRIRERLTAVEAAVQGPWFLGEVFSALDLYAVMFTRWRDARENGWREEFLPKLCTIADALKQRPAIAPVWEAYFPNG
jgi:GST-like protein